MQTTRIDARSELLLTLRMAREANDAELARVVVRELRALREAEERDALVGDVFPKEETE